MKTQLPQLKVQDNDLYEVLINKRKDIEVPLCDYRRSGPFREGDEVTLLETDRDSKELTGGKITAFVKQVRLGCKGMAKVFIKVKDHQGLSMI